jgi:CheY-like chemotaxis protein
MANLLLVDDDADMVELIADLLREHGHVVRVATNGLEGLQSLDCRLPDAVLLDVEMPRLNGPEMADQMFALDVGREAIPIVLFSAEVQLDRIADRVGTPYFLSKPRPVEDVLAVLERALSERAPPHPRRSVGLHL